MCVCCNLPTSRNLLAAGFISCLPWQGVKRWLASRIQESSPATSWGKAARLARSGTANQRTLQAHQGAPLQDLSWWDSEPWLTPGGVLGLCLEHPWRMERVCDLALLSQSILTAALTVEHHVEHYMINSKIKKQLCSFCSPTITTPPASSVLSEAT